MPGIGLDNAENTGGKDMAPAVLRFIVLEDSPHSKTWPKKRNVDQ